MIKRCEGWLKRVLVSALLMILLGIGFTDTALSLSEDILTVYYLDVGQANAVIAQCGNEFLMVDGGNADDSSLVFSFLRNTLNTDHIDYMIATHPHEDHIGELAGALNACSVGVLFSPVSEYVSDSFAALKQYADRQGLNITVPESTESFSLGSAQVQIIPSSLSFSDINNWSLITRITYGTTSFLFMGDAKIEEEQYLIDSGADLSATVLMVGHHGSNSSTSYVFLRESMPTYAIISVGAGNAYGHPTEEILSRLRDADVQVFRTDLQGQITLMCLPDGRITVSTERNASTSDLFSAETVATAAPTERKASPETDIYIGNINSKKLHYPACQSVADMKESNKVVFHSRDEAISQGYVPCQNCNP